MPRRTPAWFAFTLVSFFASTARAPANPRMQVLKELTSPNVISCKHPVSQAGRRLLMPDGADIYAAAFSGDLSVATGNRYLDDAIRQSAKVWI